MFNNEAVILPFNLPNWKHVLKYLIEINDNYENIKTTSDVIKTLRKLKNVFDSSDTGDCSQDNFVGFGLFLEKFNKNELEIFIKNNLRHIFYYLQLIESLIDYDVVKLSVTNNVVKISLAAAKALIACSVTCLMPNGFINDNGGSYGRIVNVNFDDLFKAISFGSLIHTQLLQSVLEYFSTCSKQDLDQEMATFIIITLYKYEANLAMLNESVTSWPIILTSDMSMHKTPLHTIENIWPVCFSEMIPSIYFNHPNFKPGRTLGTTCPVLVIILPIFTLGSADMLGSNVINVTWDGIHHTCYRITPLDPWNPDPQFSIQYLETSIMDCFLAFQCLLSKYQLCGSFCANNLGSSVIDDAILKLQLTKSREMFAASRSVSNIIDSRRIERLSLSYIFYNSRRPRDTSISSNSSSSRSARQSYSTSSSSRSGSLQLSTLSSRRSSNISANKDPDCSNISTTNDKADFSSHGFHPIILEESNNPIDEEECLLLPHRKCHDFSIVPNSIPSENQFDELMSAPISDSKKLSLSKDYLHLMGEKCSQPCFSKRRNSSPTLTSLISQDVYKHSYEMTTLKMKTTKRCCEEDASNNRLTQHAWSRSSYHGRRQSLPCHLQWLYQLPLTDSIKLNLSHSQILTNEMNENFENMNAIVSDWSNYFVDNCFRDTCRGTLKGVVNIANRVLIDILPSELWREHQVDLRQDILKYRSTFADQGHVRDISDCKESADEQQMYATSPETLHSYDLASFDKELFSSTFFDDDAFHFFRKFSNLNSPSNIFPDSTYEFTDSKTEDSKFEDTANMKTMSTSENVSLSDYASLLTLVIIAEAIDQETYLCESAAASASLHRFADTMSVDIIANCLAEIPSRNKKQPNPIPPVFVGSFPVGYHGELGMLMQILAAAVTQQATGTVVTLVCDHNGDTNLSKVLTTINDNKMKLTPYRLYSVMTQYFTDSSWRKQTDFNEFLLQFL